jgi:SET domain-containing protein
MKESTYRPLPKSLTIKESTIHGLGLFAAEDISSGTNLGISHTRLTNCEMIRTPLGGFYNHSENPNCEKRETYFSYDKSVECEYEIVSLVDIKKGEEITVEYTLYNIL